MNELFTMPVHRALFIISVAILLAVGGIEFMGFTVYIPENEHRYFLIFSLACAIMSWWSYEKEKDRALERQKLDAGLREEIARQGGNPNDTLIKEPKE